MQVKYCIYSKNAIHYKRYFGQAQRLTKSSYYAINDQKTCTKRIVCFYIVDHIICNGIITDVILR